MFIDRGAKFDILYPSSLAVPSRGMNERIISNNPLKVISVDMRLWK